MLCKMLPCVALGALQLRTHRLAALQLACVNSTASAMDASMMLKVNSPIPCRAVPL